MGSAVAKSASYVVPAHADRSSLYRSVRAAVWNRPRQAECSGLRDVAKRERARRRRAQEERPRKEDQRRRGQEARGRRTNCQTES